MRCFTVVLFVAGLVAFGAAMVAEGPRALGEEGASALRGGVLITDAKCQQIDTCNEFNLALERIWNTDCSSAGTCSSCEHDSLVYRGCQTDPTLNCRYYSTGTDCGIRYTGACFGSTCMLLDNDGDCLNAPNCANES